jgi:hypothetical protein
MGIAMTKVGGHKAGWCTDERLVVMASEVTEVGGHEKCTAIDGRWRVQRLTLLAYFLLISSSMRSSRSSEKCDGITRATSLISASTNMAVIHRLTTNAPIEVFQGMLPINSQRCPYG